MRKKYLKWAKTAVTTIWCPRKAYKFSANACIKEETIVDLEKVKAEHTILLDFSLTVKAAPHECVIRTSQP